MTRPHRRLTELRKLLRHFASRDNDRAREDAATIAWAMGCVEALADVASDRHCCAADLSLMALGRAIDDHDVAEMVKEEA